MSDVLALLDANEVGAVADGLAADRDARAHAYLDDVGALEGQLGDLAKMFGEGAITMIEWQAARTAIEDRLAEAKAWVVVSIDNEARAKVMAKGSTIRADWPTMNLEQKRTVLKALVEIITVAPTDRTNNRFDESRITVTWRH